MDAIEILRCPSCWSEFQPAPLNGSLFQVDGYGTLTCECGIFPVVNGIPVLDRRHNEQRLVALIKKGAFSRATSECLMVDVQRRREIRFFWKVLRKLGFSNGLYERLGARHTFRDATAGWLPEGECVSAIFALPVLGSNIRCGRVVACSYTTHIWLGPGCTGRCGAFFMGAMPATSASPDCHGGYFVF